MSRRSRLSWSAPRCAVPTGLKHVVFGWRCAPACRAAPARFHNPTRAAPSCSPGPRKSARRPVGFRRQSTRGQGQRLLGRRSLAISSLPDPLHQRVHPCRGRPSDAIPHDTRDRNEEASFHRLASYGNPRFGALQHACRQRKSRALGPLQRGAPPGQDIGSAGGAEQASSDVDDSTPGDGCTSSWIHLR